MMMNTAMTRRAALATLAGAGVTACGSSPTLDLIGSSFSAGKPAGSGGYPVTSEYIRNLPYASLGVRVGRNPPGVMVLATYDGDRLNWASSDRIILVTQNGRLVKTVGLARDLVGTQWVGADPVLNHQPGAGWLTDSRVNLFIDVHPDDEYGVAIESTLREVRAERIDIMEWSYDTRVIAETIMAPKWRWSAENLFWIDQATNRVVRSRQSFCPQIEPLTLETLKPAAVVRPA